MRRRTDRNHAEIVKALREAGCAVADLSGVGKGVADALVCTPTRRLVLIEVKDGSKPPSERDLTPAQRKWHARWPVHVVLNVDEALAAVGIRRAA